jgi:bla regulator protein BlaR1
MTMLLNMLIVNAVVVVPLAGVVWGLTRLARRPALTHMLWVIVLLKLITPPFFTLPFSFSIPVASPSQVGTLELPPASLPATTGQESRPAPTPIPEGDASGTSLAGSGAVAEVAAAPARMGSVLPIDWVRRSVAVCQKSFSWCLQSPGVRWLGLALWCLGALIWFGFQTASGLSFWKRNVRHSAVDSQLQRQSRQLAERFGLRRSPQVVLIQSQVSPMLWGYGPGLRLLFPADLARRLDHDSRGTLLAHELAHYSRGDHWIRVLELLVTGLFWWHPIVWVARRQIEESEEECCDAWVVAKLPHPPRRYAEALLDTIDFLCDAPVPLPPLASGLGPAAFLRRRLTRIMTGVSPKELSSLQRCGIALIALLGLPWQPFVLGSRPTVSLSEALVPPVSVQIRAPAAEIEIIESVQEPAPPATVSSDVLPPIPESSMRRANRSTRGERIWGTAVSSNGHFAIHITTARRVLLADLASNEQSDLSSRGLTSVAFFPDGVSFVAGGSDGEVTLWSATTGEMIRSLYTHDDVVRSVAVSPSGKAVAIGGRNGSVLLIDVATNQLVAELSRADSPVNCVRFSPDGRRLAVAVGDWKSNDPGQVAIWNLEIGRADSVLACDSAPGAICFVSNDELIVGQWNGHTSLWNLVNRQIVGSAQADKNDVTAASFSPDNPVLREVDFVADGRSGDATTESADSNPESVGS